MSRPRGGSRARYVLSSLREDIVAGHFAPGLNLVEDALSDHYGVSRLPIREALRVLEAEGYVVITPNRGAAVAVVAQDEAEDLLDVLDIINELNVRRAATDGAAGQHSELVEIVRRGQDAHRRGDVREEADLDRAVQSCLAVMSGSEPMLQMFRQVSRKVEWLFSIDYASRADPWPSYAAIAAAVGRGDGPAAVRACAEQSAKARASYRFRLPG